ncbi:MAG: aminotransferase class I/II-fold pyridoxal phosphate-dependent enzyme [Pseudomonadota bacterium]
MSDTQAALTGTDHGGGIDAVITKYGGRREDWLDLSTGINPNPYPFSQPKGFAWSSLPDATALHRAELAARTAWNIPDDAALLLTPGLSVAIAQLPYILAGDTVTIPDFTYNEFRNAFVGAGWTLKDGGHVRIALNPNNPTGDWVREKDVVDQGTLVIDESFADEDPKRSLMHLSTRANTLILRGLGKFWGLAGLRFGAVIGDPNLITQLKLRLGPWAVSGPALSVAAEALADPHWISATRKQLKKVAGELDDAFDVFQTAPPKGTWLFRLYSVNDAHSLFEHLAKSRILTRVFPSRDHDIRFGMPKNDGELARIKLALDAFRL